ncbi:hypothetical protein V6N11_063688 [Hibiscus sabdariffa]|uniref:Cysteine-rich receptor-like protein kinase 10 n=1 Tax=Hibiscus sabdariffa TaxID=183260 RepID=A0ABR2PLQ8_9ROSI
MDIFKALINLLPCLVAIVLSLLSPVAEAQQPTYLYHDCSNTTTFSRNSTYQANRDALLSSLSSNGSRGDGFYNTTSGRGADLMYGLFLCRGDLSTNVCQACVTFAAGDIPQHCPVEITAVIWYDECLLRYSNQSIFSSVAEEPAVVLANTQNITGQDRFNQLLQATMDDTATEAANASAGAKKFAIREANFSSFRTLYTLAQCTPDLSSTDCDRCLQFAMGNLPIGVQGGRLLSPSCNVRYEIYPFYNQTAVPPPPPPPATPPPPAPASGGNGRRTWPIIVAIVAPIVVSILFLFLACWLLRRRASKKDDHVQAESAGYDITTVDSLQYDFTTIETATDNFSDANKIGEGGFGEVYKGILPNKQEIAVKRLSRDGDMNPKISDFGMARIFGVDQTQGTTRRVVGTYGYMSPEYAMHGQFSVKSDVYSFGVLVLEIISGQKNSSFYETDGAQDLISYAWKLWKDGRPLEFRSSEGRMPYKGLESDKSTSQSAPWSINDVSITELDPR